MKPNKQHQKPGIYCIRNIENNKVYIGKAINIFRRIRDHIYRLNSESDNSCNEHLKRAWLKYGVSKFEYFVLEFLNLDENILKERELYWINEYQSLDKLKGYNLRSDSESSMIIHPLTSKKISERLKNEWSQGNRSSHTDKL